MCCFSKFHDFEGTKKCDALMCDSLDISTPVCILILTNIIVPNKHSLCNMFNLFYISKHHKTYTCIQSLEEKQKFVFYVLISIIQ